jgi:hypothetical protein
MWSYPLSRVEQYFPVSSSEPATVLLLNPAQDSSVPPLDLLKLSTFLQSRGYATRLQKDVLNNAPEEPYAVVLTSVFSWEVPALRRAVNDVCRLWPQARRILSGVLPRRLGPTMRWRRSGTPLSLSLQKGFARESAAIVRQPSKAKL